jgi:hypothetical protein
MARVATIGPRPDQRADGGWIAPIPVAAANPASALSSARHQQGVDRRVAEASVDNLRRPVVTAPSSSASADEKVAVW